MPDTAAPAGGPLRGAALRRVQQMETLLAPQAFMDEVGATEGGNDAALIAAVRSSAVTADLREQMFLRPYRAEELGKCVILYRGTANPAGRNLVVGFAGKSNRLMLPAAMLLQRLPKEWDMLILRDPAGQHYRLGAGDIGGDFLQLAAWIARVGRPYGRMVAMGTSMGALAAARLALILPGVGAIAVGARPPLDIGRLFRAGGPPPAYDPVCACLPEMERDILFVHSAGHATDACWAVMSAAHCGGRVFAVPGAEIHGTLYELWLAGRLQPFLAAALSEVPMDGRLAAIAAATALQAS